MITKHPASHEGYRCLAQCSLEPKIRMLALAQALNLNPALLPQTIEDLQQSLECSFGPTITEPEWDQIPLELDAHLTKPWPDALYGQEAEGLHRILWLNRTPPRETIKFLGYELPRNFSWVYPLRIAGMSTPRNEEDVDCLERMGVTDLLSLNKEGPLPRQWFKLKRIKHHQVLLENYAAPTCAEMDVIWERVSAGGVWVVHCGGGGGRAGTVLACLMTMLGRGDGEKRWNDKDEKKPSQDDQGMSNRSLLALLFEIQSSFPYSPYTREESFSLLSDFYPNKTPFLPSRYSTGLQESLRVLCPLLVLIEDTFPLLARLFEDPFPLPALPFNIPVPFHLFYSTIPVPFPLLYSTIHVRPPLFYSEIHSPFPLSYPKYLPPSLFSIPKSMSPSRSSIPRSLPPSRSSIRRKVSAPFSLCSRGRSLLSSPFSILVVIPWRPKKPRLTCRWSRSRRPPSVKHACSRFRRSDSTPPPGSSQIPRIRRPSRLCLEVGIPSVENTISPSSDYRTFLSAPQGLFSRAVYRPKPDQNRGRYGRFQRQNVSPLPPLLYPSALLMYSPSFSSPLLSIFHDRFTLAPGCLLWLC